MKISWNNKEWLIIALAWLLIYASDPLYMWYAHLVGDIDFRWTRIFQLWGHTTFFFILFLVHHFVLIPKFVEKKRLCIYATCAVTLLVTFTLANVLSDPWLRPDNGEPHFQTPHLLLTPPDLARLIIAILMLGVDLGAVAWINDQKMRQRLLQLEKQTLKQELEHLRYQINPHFFMNTLNNIHALVDIDQERAKRAIIELSGMMRYSLYEGNDTLVPISHETEFLNLYISLMRLRFNDNVHVECQLPESIPSEVMMPPMLLATLVENAFKHGISYQAPSYINIDLSIDASRRLHFKCENSRHNVTTPDGHHGIGLSNVRKRLDLQYRDTYSFNIDESDPQRFIIELTLPSSSL